LVIPDVSVTIKNPWLEEKIRGSAYVLGQQKIIYTLEGKGRIADIR